MIENFIDSALIIDDKESEIVNLKTLLESKEILSKHYLPADLKEDGPILKNRKIIFLDLYVEEEKNLVDNISIIRGILRKRLGKKFGNYGIVLWSKHTDDIEEFKERISKDKDNYTYPLFIIGLDKTKYMQAGNYDSLLADLDEKLNESLAASFFINWDTLVRRGKDNAIKNIYSLVTNFSTQDQDLKFILLKLAQNYTGIPETKTSGYSLEHDAVKSFTDMLHSEIVNGYSPGLVMFANPETITFSGDELAQKNVYAELNSKLLLDFTNINQGAVIPGNIYEIKDVNSLFWLDQVPPGSKRIIIEVTPPCDFAVDKKARRSRVLGGFYCPNNISNTQIKESNKDNFYKELNSINITGTASQQMIRFDFRYSGSLIEDDLKDAGKYQILFRAKDKLFADILQKLSSHSARLGLSVIK